MRVKSKKFDVGITGIWYGLNYGSSLTYYSLQSVIKELGLSPLMIEKPDYNPEDPERMDNHSRRFAEENFNISPIYPYYSQKLFNEFCEGFIVGSDQIWNYGISRGFGKTLYLDFAADNKKKIAYAPSFGHEIDFAPPEEQKTIAKLLKRFDAISVREADGARLLKDVYDIDAASVLDPVFIVNPDDLHKLAERGKIDIRDQYLLCYILDVTPEKKELLINIAKILGLRPLIILDGFSENAENSRKILDMPKNLVNKPEVYDWIKLFKNASYVLTDSFYGMSLAILFGKQFLALPNLQRGVSRFYCLANTFNLSDRLLPEPFGELNEEKITAQIDYTNLGQILKTERENSKNWLKQALESISAAKSDAVAKKLKNNIANYLDLKNSCTGCSSCYNICPVDAISMNYNIDGFLEPAVDEAKCVSCGKCITACPVCNPVYVNNERPECYAAIAKDEELRMKSSSGGMFSLFADEIFNKKGVVCGAAYNDDFLVEHIIIDSKADLDKLRGSKYLQSDTKTVYKEIKNRLERGQTVLFCGCPCQVGGLNTFLGKEYPNLLTIDLMCHGGPSPLLFKKYLAEAYPNRELERFSFRDKSVFGWSTEANAYFKDGTSEHIKRDQDDYYRAFLPCLSVRKSCGTCKFAKLPRQGDITLADFWGVSKYNASFDDGKGTSIVIVNSKKGKKAYKSISSNLKLKKEVPLGYILKVGQPFDKPFKSHPERDRYFEIVRHNSLKKAFHYIRNRKYDFGIVGLWPGLNYGSVLTYYALQKELRDNGISPLMIDISKTPKDPDRLNTHSRLFANEHFYISPLLAVRDFHVFNKSCDGFIMGSDQVWNYGLSKAFGKTFYLDFAHDEKKKIAYAASFGHQIDFAPPAEQLAISRLLKRFDAISVREDSGVTLCRDIYGVEATQVMDPVFIIDPDNYHELASRSKRKEETPYLLVYVLDVTQEKKELMLDMSRKLGLRLVILLDGITKNGEKNRKILDLDENVRMGCDVYDWLYYFQNSSYVLTDSFHGVSFSILFNKQFLPLINKQRGHARFASIARLLNFEYRLVNNPVDAQRSESYMKLIDYSPINPKIDEERTRCQNWLHEAIHKPKIVTGIASYLSIDTRVIKFLKKELGNTKNTPVAEKDDTNDVLDGIDIVDNTPPPRQAIIAEESQKEEQYLKLSDWNKFITRYNKKQQFLDLIKFSLFGNHDKLTIEDKINWCAKETYRFCKYYPNIKNPHSFNEWINYYKLFYEDRLMTYCVNKYTFKDYVQQKLGSDNYTTKLYTAAKDINDIQFSDLPDEYVIKSNISSGGNNFIKVCRKTVDIDALKSRISKWINPYNNIYYHTYDWAYKDIEPMIICEEFFRNKNREIKIFCFAGEPKFLYVDSDSSAKVLYNNCFDTEWNLLPARRHGRAFSVKPEKPQNLTKLLEIARILSEPFPHVRVDFMLSDTEIKLSELTFYSGSGFHPWSPREWDFKFGEYFSHELFDRYRERSRQI